MTPPLTDEEYLRRTYSANERLLRLLDEHAALKRNQCTVEERKVLDQISALPLRMMLQWADKQTYVPALRELGAAELARREAERAKGAGT